MNSEFQYVHEASVASTCDPSTSRWSVSSKSALACRSIPITCRPLSNARGGSRSAMPRATWYAARKPNQIASWRPKSAHPRGNTRRPTETKELTRNGEF